MKMCGGRREKIERIEEGERERERESEGESEGERERLTQEEKEGTIVRDIKMRRF